MTATMVAVLKPGAGQKTATPLTAQVAAQPTARKRLRDWLRKHIDGQTEVRAPDVAAAAETALSSDQALMADLGRETLRGVIYELTLDVIASTRAHHDDIDTLPGPVERVNGTDARARVERKLAVLERRYTKWLEHVGDRHIRLIDLKAADLEVAEMEHRTRGITEIRTADFLAILRVRLGKSGKAVGEKLSFRQIEDLRIACMAPAQKEEESDGNL
jgi:hypothetical protein